MANLVRERSRDKQNRVNFEELVSMEFDFLDKVDQSRGHGSVRVKSPEHACRASCKASKFKKIRKRDYLPNRSLVEISNKNYGLSLLDEEGRGDNGLLKRTETRVVKKVRYWSFLSIIIQLRDLRLQMGLV